MKLTGFKTSGLVKRRGSRGFTLVELIVVLIIISILATAGIATAIGYINYSKFNKNEQNAITIYQTSQTAMSQMTAAGIMDSWVRGIIEDESIARITAIDPIADPEANETVGKTVYLTYNPGMPNSESKVVHDFLSKYFYDQTIFTGTISIEFYISMTYDANKIPYYSARVISAFFSFENKATEGWDTTCLNGSTDGLPDRDTEHRYSKTFVGYYDGTEASSKPQVVSVFLPRSQSYILDGHIVGPTVDPTQSAVGYLFNLRNGETLDVTWAMFDEDGYLHADADRDEEITIKLHDAGIGNSAIFSDVVLTIGPDTLDSVRYSKLSDSNFNPSGTCETVVEKINDYIITRTSYDSTVEIKVNNSNYIFPITVTKVEGDGRTGCPVDSNGNPVAYIEYRLSLDCMMIRSDETLNNKFRYNSERLFSGDNSHSIPRNIYASITGKFYYYTVDESNKESVRTPRTIPLTYAARAMDDPVYFTGMSGTTYVYDLPNRSVEGKTINDGDNTTNEDTGAVITGRCIVNTLFGDALLSNSAIGGTAWSSTGGDAVITSYRHLSNIRWIDSTKTVNYRIIRNLDWYVHSGDKYVSEVRVYMSYNRGDRASYGYDGVRYHSPAENNNLHIVSFPAICKLGDNQTLTSMSASNGKIYSINNVQMRAASFNGTDAGYGLVCTNRGLIYNIYTNNLNLVLTSVVDGSLSDYDLISPDGSVTINNVTETMTFDNKDSIHVGGLVGYNLGSVGKNKINNETIDENVNTVCMNNCIVLAGNYWDLQYYNAGSVIGQNKGSTNGVIEVCGSFAIAGGGTRPDDSKKRGSVGGLIGDNKANINARLIVDGTGTSSQFRKEIELPYISHNDSKVSCIVAGCGQVGGAIGWTETNEFVYDVNTVNSDSIRKNTTTGEITFPDITDRDYQIDVNLPADSLVLKVASDDDRCAGGAIGKIYQSKGSYLSIRVNNNGNIITTDTNMSVSCGGAIGEEEGCTITTTYIEITNGAKSRIGYLTDDSGPICAGGAYGIIKSDAQGRTILVNATNDGTIVSRGSGNGQGSGGAIGGIVDSNAKNSLDVCLTLLLNIFNDDNSKIIGTGNDQTNGNGVGGVIGGMGNNNSSGSPEFTYDSVIFADNSGTISGNYHVGGAVGNAPVNKGKIYAVNSGTISGSDFVGGAVGSITYDHYGTIQAIMDTGSIIKANNFVGGAAGRLTKFQDDAVLKTIVRGNSDIDKGNGSIVGGICGDLRIAGTGIGGTIELIGDSSNPILTVKGKDGVGGAVGLFRSALVNSAEIKTPDQSSTNKLAVHVSGANYIGGVVGFLRVTSAGVNETNLNTLFNTVKDNNNALDSEILVNISAKLNPGSYIYGSGNNVGGAVGYIDGKFSGENTYTKFGGRITVSTLSGSTSSAAYIRGFKNVGGAVGAFNNVVPFVSAKVNNGCIDVDFSSAIWSIEATAGTNKEADAGGAVGSFLGLLNKRYGSNSNTYPIKVNLGYSTVFSAGYNVGGVIGKNQVRNGIITANNIGGTITGQYNVGGAIGLNEYQFNEVNVTVTSTGIVEAVGYFTAAANTYANGRTPDGSKGDGSNVGGAIGKYSFTENGTVTITTKISATISGYISGPGNNVGGAVGYCNSSKNKHLIRNVIAVVQGDATVCGADNVGGTIGFSLSNITNVKSDISGTSSIEGHYHVGGAIGWTYALEGKGGASVLAQNPETLNPDDLSIADLETRLGNNLYNQSGRIANIVATISSDYALQGFACIGGAVGQSGFKSPKVNNVDIYSSPALINVQANINTGYLFDPSETGLGLDEINPIDKPKANVEGAYGNSCIGGVIGLVVDGRINSVTLGGTGGTVNTDDSYPCPEISMSGAVLMAAKGHSIGGIIGQIGLLGYGNAKIGTADGTAQNVTVSSISASDDLAICVVSMNGANKIGGWIGSGYGVYGGLGNRFYNDYKKEETRTKNKVSNVRYVFSEGSYVGGFCGYSRGYRKNTNADTNTNQGPGLVTWVDIDVILSKATIIGNSAVGGAFGGVEGVRFAGGYINVELKDHSVIGDPVGSTICNEAGGAIGYLNVGSEIFGIPVTVTIDSTSNIRAAGSPTDTDDKVYGVGGALGRCTGTFGRNKYDNTNFYDKVFPGCAGTLTVKSDDSASISVYSLNSNVGGVIGVMDNVNMSGYFIDANNNYWSYAENVTVQADGDNACVGGFVGKINSLSDNMYNCYCYGTGSIYANGTAASAGGFAGDVKIESGKTINSCYTTFEVKSTGAYTGGFVGRMIQGKVNNCYVGGHTFQGSYVAGEGNITGAGNVGGFVGATTGTNTVAFKDCYSTASVRGTQDNVGGFIGSSTSATTIKDSYCTGRVVGPYKNTIGSFAGTIGNSNLSNYTGNQVMRNINPGDFALIGAFENTSVGEGNIKYVADTEIGTGSDTGHPFDSLLKEKSFTLRAVIGNDHYGDWPIAPVGTSINDATIQIYVKTGETELGEPIYEWVVFENDNYEYVFNGTMVALDESKLRIIVQGEEVTNENNENYIIYYRDNSKVGTATITFAAKIGSAYSGAISRTFKITAADIEGVNAEFNETEQEYNGARIIPGLTVTYNNATLVMGTDYTLSFDRDGDIEAGFDNDNRSIGTMFVYLVGKGNYTGIKLIGQYKITTINLSNLSDDSIDLIGADNLVYDEVDGKPVEHRPNVAVRVKGQTINGIMKRDDAEDYEYAKNYDYIISYENNINAGTAYLVITGTADTSIGVGEVYTGTKKIPFTISPAVNTWTADPTMDGWIYGENPNAPIGSVKYGEIDYKFFFDVTCNNPIADISTVDIGKYYVQVFAKDSSESGNFTGPTPVILSFTISPSDISAATVTIKEPAEYKYNGSPIDIDKADIKVTVGEGDAAYDLEPDDYTIASYDPSGHTEPGIVTITIAGTGNYEGTATGTFTIYREYTVRFISNGQQIGSEPVRDGNAVPEPTKPVYSGYRFDGWYKDEACTEGKEYKFDAPVTEDIRLYAKWVKVWTVTFDTGDPDVVIADNPQTVDQGKNAVRPIDPVRPGYRFDGWYKDGVLYTFTKVYGDITLEAQWIPEYTISFHTGEGSQIDSQYLIEDEVVTEPEDPPIWEGHTFDGWYSDEECTTRYDFAEKVKNSFTLYAKWSDPPDGG